MSWNDSVILCTFHTDRTIVLKYKSILLVLYWSISMSRNFILYLRCKLSTPLHLLDSSSFKLFRRLQFFILVLSSEKHVSPIWIFLINWRLHFSLMSFKKVNRLKSAGKYTKLRTGLIFWGQEKLTFRDMKNMIIL